MKSPAEEIDRRRPVWQAMSAFFLDTELDAADDERIADVLAASGYSIDELERILWHELSPILHWNLMSIAGEWAGFDMQSVEQQILSHPAGKFRRWWSHITGGHIARHAWSRVRQILVTQNMS